MGQNLVACQEETMIILHTYIVKCQHKQISEIG